MSTTQMIILLLVLVAAGGGAYYVMQGSGDAMTRESETEGTAMDESAAESAKADTTLSGAGSFFELMRLGESVRCEYTFEDQDGVSGSGVGYFADGKMNLEAETSHDGEVFDSSIIHDGEMLYMWTGNGDNTFAMKVTAPESEAEVTQDSSYSREGQGTVSLDQNVQYDCDRWDVDASVFVPPSDIEFTDMNAMMNEAMQGMPEGFEMPRER